jgi:hypothetical protein
MTSLPLSEREDDHPHAPMASVDVGIWVSLIAGFPGKKLKKAEKGEAGQTGLRRLTIWDGLLVSMTACPGCRPTESRMSITTFVAANAAQSYCAFAAAIELKDSLSCTSFR